MNTVQKFAHHLCKEAATLYIQGRLRAEVDVTEERKIQKLLNAVSPAQFVETQFEGETGSLAHLVSNLQKICLTILEEDYSADRVLMELLGLLVCYKHDHPMFHGVKPLTHTNFLLCADGVRGRLDHFGVWTYIEAGDEPDEEAMTAKEAFTLLSQMPFCYRGSAAKTVEPHKRFISVISEWPQSGVQRWRPKK